MSLEIYTKAICPLCHTEIPKKKIDLDTIFYSFNAERKKISGKREGIITTISDVEAQIKIMQQKLVNLEEKIKELEEYENNTLIPQIENSNIDYNKYMIIEKSKAKIGVYEKQLFEINQKIEKYQKLEDIGDLPVKNIEKNDTLFLNRINELCTHMSELLVKFNFSENVEVYYDIEQQDFLVNNQKRKSYGQGYSGFIYITYVLSLKWISDKYGIQTPNFLFLDSPLTALTEEDEGKDKVILKSNRKVDSFFEYIINEYKNKQIILIENTDERYSKVDSKVNYIHFTKNLKLGRYGFIEE